MFTVSVPSVAGCFYACLLSVCPLWPGVSMVVYGQCALCGRVFLCLLTVSVPSVARFLFQSLPIINWFVCSRVCWYNLNKNSLSDMRFFLKIINVWPCWAFVVWAFV